MGRSIRPLREVWLIFWCLRHLVVKSKNLDFKAFDSNIGQYVFRCHYFHSEKKFMTAKKRSWQRKKVQDSEKNSRFFFRCQDCDQNFDSEKKLRSFFAVKAFFRCQGFFSLSCIFFAVTTFQLVQIFVEAFYQN